MPITQRLLILAPRGRDADTIVQVLAEDRLDCVPCADMAALVGELEAGAGAAILTEEALSEHASAPLLDWVERQPSWSDFPFLLLVSSQSRADAPHLDGTMEGLGNLLLLERPLNAATLRRAATSALRARNRQYQTLSVLNERLHAEERLRLALRAGRLGAWEIDLDSMVLVASETCRANFGRAPDDPFTYSDLFDAVHPDDREAHKNLIQDAIGTAGEFDVEFRAVWPDGSTHWVQVRGETLSDMRGRPVSIAGVSLDVTERQLAAAKLRSSQTALRQLNDTLEQRIRERTGELAQANDRLMREINERERTQTALVQAQKMEAIGRLTGGIAHDFNNLLHVISGNVDLIDHVATDARVKRFAATVKKATQRGAKLTGQLLAFARNQNLDFKSVDLVRLIEDMRDLLATSVGSRIRVECELGENVPKARVDMNQIEMAILNLAINARDAMPNGGTLKVGVALREPHADLLPPGRYAVVTVADTGTGIGPELLDKVFDPFFTTKAVGQGTGLGLSQVYGLAQQSGGTAQIASTPGVGTTVDIWLPLAAEDAADDPAQPPAQRDTHDIKVLVVEDDDEVRQFMVESLEILGYSVCQAENGASGLAKMDQVDPDLLIVDFLMPGMNGAEVVSRAVASHPHTPIILATGYADMRSIDAINGVDMVLRKPFQINDLARSVTQVLVGRA
jgi:PAS domain S-box-containing protein